MSRILRSVLFFLTFSAIAAPAASLAAPAGSTLLVSRTDGSGPVAPALDNNSQTPGAASADGRYIAFTSDADGLAPGADPHVRNLFVRDTQSGTTTLVSRSDGLDGVAADQPSEDPAITVSPAGHVLVAFSTDATNLSDHVTGPTGNPRGPNVWLRDVTAGTTTLVTRTGAAGAPLTEGTEPAVVWSAGGPLVAYHSHGILFLRTVDAGFTQIVSCADGRCDVPNPAAVTGDHPDLRVVDPAAGTLCAPPAHATPCVLIAFEAFGGAPDASTTQFGIVTGVAVAPFADGLHPTPFGEFHTVSVNNAGVQANAGAFLPSFDRDGDAVAFVSTADNLTGDPLPANRPRQAYLRTLQAGSTTLLSKALNGAATGEVESVHLGGGLANLRAVFEVQASNFPVSDDQAWLRSVATGTTSLLNRSGGAQGTAGDGSSFDPTISADGSTAAFTATSSNLGAGRSDFDRVYASQLDAPGQPVALISGPTGAAPLDNGTSDSEITQTAVSTDGRYVAFTSDSDNLSGADDDEVSGVFVRDVVTGHTVLVSRAAGADGTGANGSSFLGGISADGRRVSFTSEASNLAPGTTIGTDQAYVRDLNTNTTTLVGRASGADTPPPAGGSDAAGISANGNAVLVRSATPLDPAAGATTHTHLYVRDLSTDTTTLVDRDDGPNGTVAPVSGGFEGVIDADGGRVAFTSSAPLAGAPADNVDHVYLRDVRTGQTTLVSRAEGATGVSANDESFDPSIDADGNVVAFASVAQNLGVAGKVSRVWVRDIAAAHTELISVPLDPTALPTSADFPSIDAAGDRVSFSVFGLQTPAPIARQIYVRDRVQQTTTLVSRADGADGAPADGNAAVSSISAAGDCVAFSGSFTNLGDGFGSADFDSVHLRTLADTCPGDPPAPTGGRGGGGSTTTTTTTTTHATAPALSALALSPSRFHVGGKRGGTTVRFTLSAAAAVTLRFQRTVTGHRHGTRCAAGGHGKTCALVTTVGSLTVSAKRGRNSVRFAGRLKGHTLRPGRYRLTATPARGKARTVTFTVLATPKPKARPSH
jgi:Tol biopolymer transport system component